jgi:hypothetical protein
MNRFLSRFGGAAAPKAPKRTLPVFAALCLVTAAALFSACDMGGGGLYPPMQVIATPTFNQIDLTWTASSGAGWYTVHYHTSPSPAGAQTLTTTATGAALTGLPDDTVYYVWITAHGGAGSSGFSSTAQAKTSEALPSAFYDSTWSTIYDTYIIADYKTPMPLTERWELTYSDYMGTTGGEGSSGFMGFIKYYASQTPSNGKTGAGVIILEYHSEEYAPLGSWEGTYGSGAPPGRGLFGAVYFHTLAPGTSATMGNANNLPAQGNVEETTLKAAVDKFGPAGSMDTYYSFGSFEATYDYAAL